MKKIKLQTSLLLPKWPKFLPFFFILSINIDTIQAQSVDIDGITNIENANNVLTRGMDRDSYFDENNVIGFAEF